jgi:hypothetical protein
MNQRISVATITEVMELNHTELKELPECVQARAIWPKLELISADFLWEIGYIKREGPFVVGIPSINLSLIRNTSPS